MGPFCLLVMIAFSESISRENGKFRMDMSKEYLETTMPIVSSKELEQQTRYNVYHQYQKEKKNYRNLTQETSTSAKI